MTVIDRTSSEFKAWLELYERTPLLELGALADAQRWRLHPKPVVSYIIDRNINYTNVCVTDCSFCAFYRRPGDGEAYLLPREVLYRKIGELRAAGGLCDEKFPPDFEPEPKHFVACWLYKDTPR